MQLKSPIINLYCLLYLLQITPAHDPNDFLVGKRHNMEFINIFSDDGMINRNGGREFEGLKRFDARVAVIEALKSKVSFTISCQNKCTGFL